MTSETLLVLSRLSQFTILVPLIIGAFKWKRLSQSQFLLTIVCGLSLITESVAVLIFEYSENPNNTAVYNIFALMLFMVLSRIFRAELKGFIPTLVIDVLVISILCFGIGKMLFLQSIDVLNSDFITLASLTYVLFSILYFLQLLRLKVYERLEKNSIFWLSTGLLIYNLSTVILFFLIQNVIAGSSKLMITSWGLNAVLNILLNLFYSVSIFTKSRSTRI